MSSFFFILNKKDEAKKPKNMATGQVQRAHDFPPKGTRLICEKLKNSETTINIIPKTVATKQKLKKIVEKAISGLTNKPVDFSIEIPGDKNNGDYSTNVALVLAKKIGKNPREVADSIKEKIKSDLFGKIEVAGPGFINFFIDGKVFIDNLKKIDKDFGRGNELKNKKLINPPPLSGLPHKLNETSSENKVEIKTVKK